VYATLSDGSISIYSILKDGKSKKLELPLYGSAVGLVSEMISGKKNCFRVIHGIEEVNLQALSYEDMMDWCKVIAHGISMENGGGLLLDKAKNSTSISTRQHQDFSIIREVPIRDNVLEFKSSIVFSKQLEEAVTEEDKIQASMKNTRPDFSHQSQSFETVDSLNNARSTDSPEINSMFKTHNLVGLSETIQDFSCNFFTHAKKSVDTRIEALELENLSHGSSESTEGSKCLALPWLEIDKALSTTGSVALSDEDIIEKHLDLNANSHLSAKDFASLLRYNECINVSDEKVSKTREVEDRIIA